jgi:hypothetical protein
MQNYARMALQGVAGGGGGVVPTSLTVPAGNMVGTIADTADAIILTSGIVQVKATASGRISVSGSMAYQLLSDIDPDSSIGTWRWEISPAGAGSWTPSTTFSGSFSSYDTSMGNTPGGGIYGSVFGGLTSGDDYDFRLRGYGPGGGASRALDFAADADAELQPAAAVTAPTVFGVGTFASSANATSASWPASIANGDIGILIIRTSNQTIATPSGWTAITNGPGTGTAATAGSVRLGVFWKRTTGTESAVTIADSGDSQYARIIVIRGARATGSPIMAASTVNTVGTATTSATINGLTTTDEKAMILDIIGVGAPDAASTTNFSAWANANLSSVTERIDNTNAVGTGGGFGVASGIKNTAGATGSSTATIGSAKYESIKIAIAAAGT